jgi:hypothetical protein
MIETNAMANLLIHVGAKGVVKREMLNANSFYALNNRFTLWYFNETTFQLEHELFRRMNCIVFSSPD